MINPGTAIKKRKDSRTEPGMTVGVQTGMTGDLFYDYSCKSPFGGAVAWAFTLFSGLLREMAHPAVSIDL